MCRGTRFSPGIDKSTRRGFTWFMDENKYVEDPIRDEYMPRIADWDNQLRAGMEIPEGSQLDALSQAYPEWPLTLFVRQNLHTAVDNLLCICKLHEHESGEVHRTALPALARSALASACTAIWQLYPDDAGVRTTRGLQLVQVNNKNFHDAFKKPPEFMGPIDPEGAQGLQDFHNMQDRGVAAAFKRHGLQKKGPSKDTQIVEWVAGVTEPIEFTRPGEVIYLWRRCSGDVHGQMWPSFTPFPEDAYDFVNDLMGVGTALTLFAFMAWEERAKQAA